MNKISLLVLFLFGCSVDPYIVRRANVRIQAADRLEWCLGLARGDVVTESKKQMCLQESREFCAAGGLESTCGIGDLWHRDYRKITK
ncbi:MAG: hypothetical protein EBZ49_15610 [Proteobacteria bacterium]|nr:hypothetical protein [Pseudomonadota bacterium]